MTDLSLDMEQKLLPFNFLDFPLDAKPLYTATLDRVTYRNGKKHNVQNNKPLTNNLQYERYQIISKSVTGSRLKEGHENGNSHLNCIGGIDDWYSYKPNGKSKEDPVKRPKSMEKLLDEVQRNCCDLPVKKSGKSVTGDEKAKHKDKEQIYETISSKRSEKKRERHSRRPRSAPLLDVDCAEQGKKCSHKLCKITLPPPAYQDPVAAPQSKYRHSPATSTTSVLNVENNNKIILKVEPIKSPSAAAATNGKIPSEASSALLAPPPVTKRLRCASVPAEKNKAAVPRSAVSLPCMPIRNSEDSVSINLSMIPSPLSPPSSRPSSPAISSSSSNFTSECSGWVSSGDTSSSETRSGKLSNEVLRRKLSRIASKADSGETLKESVEEHSYEEVRLPPPKMFQDECPPPEEFRDPPATIDNPLYHVYETVKRSKSPKQNKTAPCSPQKSKRERSTAYVSTADICLDCYQEGKELLQSTQDDVINFNKFKDELKRQINFRGKIYR